MLDSPYSHDAAKPIVLEHGTWPVERGTVPYRPVSSVLAIAPRVSVVIPALNEAANLPHVFATLPAWIHEIVLVDGRSTDDTVAVARRLRPDLKIVTQHGRGKGDALASGFAACSGDIVVMIDADGSTDGREIVRFVGALAAGADFAKGSRFSNGGHTDDMTLFRRYGNRCLNVLVNRVYGTRLTDLCYGYNAFWSRHLDTLAPDCPGFEVETLMTIRAAKAGLRIQEIPSHERNRIHGASNLRAIRDGWRILKVITRESLTNSAYPKSRASAAWRVSSALPAIVAPESAVSPSRALVPPPAPTVDMSVAICAHTERRWADTIAAVSSVREQRFTPYEIIVVVDHNPDLLARLKSALPDVVVIENRDARGLSGGKNTAVGAARGEVVTFLDDDAVAEPTWLGALAAPYRDAAVLGVGGLTRPRWDGVRPGWFPEEFDWVVGCSYAGMPDRPAPVRNLLGGNASFRREAFEVAGGFRTDIGRSWRRRPLGCEETEFCIRLRQWRPGCVLLFDDRAVIWHRVPADRSRFSYFANRCYAEGLSKALVTRAVGVGAGLSTELRYGTRTLPLGIARGLLDGLRGRPSGPLRAAAIVAGASAAAGGYTVGTLRAWLVRLRLAEVVTCEVAPRGRIKDAPEGRANDATVGHTELPGLPRGE